MSELSVTLCFCFFICYNTLYPLNNVIQVEQAVISGNDGSCGKQVKIRIGENVPEKFKGRVSAWPGSKHIVNVGNDRLAVDICKLVDLNVIVYPKINKVSDGVKCKGKTNAWKNIFGVGFNDPELDEKEGDAKLECMSKIIAGKNHTKDPIICLECVENKSKECAKTEKRKHISEKLTFCYYKNGNKHSVYCAHMEGEVFKI